MFKTGIITDEVSQDLSVAIQVAKDYHLDALEIRSVNEKNPFQMEKADFVAIRKQADDAGLVICNVSSPFFKCDFFDDSAVAAHMEGLKRAIEGAHIMGAKLIRGFNFWRADGLTDERLAEKYIPVVKILEAEDMVMALESEPSVNTGNMAKLAAFLKTVNHPRVQALYDPGNEICDHSAPPPEIGYEKLKDCIAHVHIKDMTRTADGYDPACIGEGQVDFSAMFAALHRDGYNGYAILETHWRVQDRMDEKLMTSPQGSDFSSGGEAASRICLDILREKYGFGA